MYKKFGEDWKCISRHTVMDRQTDKHTKDTVITILCSPNGGGVTTTKTTRSRRQASLWMCLPRRSASWWWLTWCPCCLVTSEQMMEHRLMLGCNEAVPRASAAYELTHTHTWSTRYLLYSAWRGCLCADGLTVKIVSHIYQCVCGWENCVRVESSVRVNEMLCDIMKRLKLKPQTLNILGTLLAN